MSHPASHRSTIDDSSSQMWDAVVHHLELFAASWEDSTSVPAIRDFLPDAAVRTRKLVLTELIKLDIDQRLRRGDEQPLEAYFAEFPELSEDGIPCDLLYEDFHLRRLAGKGAKADDYYSRFPSMAEQLGRLLGNDIAKTHSTSVATSIQQMELQPGDRIDDFDLLTMLGEGHFAKVFLARQRSMQRLVALKISAVRGAEAQTLAQLDHPHIVRVYDQRQLPDQEVQLVYMPYLPGGTLQTVLERSRETPRTERSGRTLLEAVDRVLHGRGEIPPSASSIRTQWAERSWPATVCALGVKLAAALDYAHRHDVLHRDVKPANVLLSAEGEPMLADFNIGSCSKLDGAGPSAMFGGSLPYMAPEHLEAFNPAHSRSPDSLDGRADLYGLGITLWELLAGQRPFGVQLKSDSWTSMLNEMVVARQEGVSSSAFESAEDGDVLGLRETIASTLNAEPADRPATAGELRQELELCLRPATRALVRPKPGGWMGVVRQYALPALLIAGLLPNIPASMFNIEYNRDEIIADWPKAQDEFQWLIAVINGIFFPIGIALVIWAMLPIARALKQMPTDREELAKRRIASLRLGSISARVCVGCWVVAGLVWIVSLRLVAGAPPSGDHAYIHFFISLVICGLIAAAYPYFIVTYLAVHVWYPALLGKHGPTTADRPALQRVERELSRYRAAAAAVPLVAVALLASRGLSNVTAVAVLCVVGLLGTGLAFVLEGRTRKDLAALAEAPSTDD